MRERNQINNNNYKKKKIKKKTRLLKCHFCWLWIATELMVLSLQSIQLNWNYPARFLVFSWPPGLNNPTAPASYNRHTLHTHTPTHTDTHTQPLTRTHKAIPNRHFQIATLRSPSFPKIKNQTSSFQTLKFASVNLRVSNGFFSFLKSSFSFSIWRIFIVGKMSVGKQVFGEIARRTLIISQRFQQRGKIGETFFFTFWLCVWCRFGFGLSVMELCCKF